MLLCIGNDSSDVERMFTKLKKVWLIWPIGIPLILSQEHIAGTSKTEL